MTDTSVRPPKQKRSQESLERVLAASIELLEEEGFDAFTIQDVSRRADVSVGAIYARFGNKESLLRAVHRHAMDTLRPEHEAVAAADARPQTPAARSCALTRAPLRTRPSRRPASSCGGSSRA